MKNDMVVFVVEGYNRYSIAALAGILDQELPELPVKFVQSRVLPEQIEELARQHRRVVLAFSEGLRAMIEILKELVWVYVIDNPALATHQAGVHAMIERLFSSLNVGIGPAWRAFCSPGSRQLV